MVICFNVSYFDSFHNNLFNVLIGKIESHGMVDFRQLFPHIFVVLGEYVMKLIRFGKRLLFEHYFRSVRFGAQL
jgi:hypothetical protein